MKTRSNKQVFYADYPLVVIAAILFAAAGFLHQRTTKPLLELTKQSTAINFKDDLLKYVSVGNKRLITDFIWVQTLLESDIDHYKGRDLNSWMYLRFKTIATLDPMFYENYNWGGRYLSIIKDDLLGAVELYKLGLKQYPDDYRLNYGLGFTYYFELSDPAKGLPHLEKIMDHPKAPSFFRSIVGKLKLTLNFDYDSALLFISQSMDETKDEVFKNRLQEDFYAVKAEKDLKCLNAGRADCDRKDSKGVDYLEDNRKFYSRSSFVPYRIKKKGDQTAAKKVNFFE